MQSLKLDKRVYIIAGHYGSGKTNIAVNLAYSLAEDGKKVRIADLDIVNPYFRTADSESELLSRGIELISPEFANTNLDLPALPPQTYSLFQNRQSIAIIDLGGDDRGAYALGRFVPMIEEENNYEMCFVVNFYRPLTRTAEEALEVMREIEQACKIKFTAIINNSNLGELTTKEAVFDSEEETARLVALSGLKLLFTSTEESLDMDGTFKLKLQSKYYETKE
jgi:hypothetical protein